MSNNGQKTGKRFGFSRGFNLIELMMSLALATIVFMATVQMFVRQSEAMSAQNDLIDMNREARFALEHLRQDLTSLGSNTTPNSDVDPNVCPKPTTSLRALQLSIDDSYQVDPTLNPFVQPVSIKIFGSMRSHCFVEVRVAQFALAYSHAQRRTAVHASMDGFRLLVERRTSSSSSSLK